jgi:hypothetical protein
MFALSLRRCWRRRRVLQAASAHGAIQARAAKIPVSYRRSRRSLSSTSTGMAIVSSTLVYMRAKHPKCHRLTATGHTRRAQGALRYVGDVKAQRFMSNDESFDVLDEKGVPTGERKHRKLVHRDGTFQPHPCARLQQSRHTYPPFPGDWHRCSHVWIYVITTDELLIQKRSEFKDSWASKWDISAAGHGASFP